MNKNNMFRGFVATVLSITFVISPVLASAQTNSELQAQINSLLQVIASLQAQLAQIQGGGTSGQFCHTFNTNLRIGDDGDEVVNLITALRKEGFIQGNGSPEDFDTDFDERIASAVVDFQEKYAREILTPNGLSRGSGYVGVSTRAKLNALYGCGKIYLPPQLPPINPPVTPPALPVCPQGTTGKGSYGSSVVPMTANGGSVSSTSISPTPPPYIAAPCISYVYPASGPVETTVVLYGTNFSYANNTITFAGARIATGVTSPDGTTIKFTIPTAVSSGPGCITTPSTPTVQGYSCPPSVAARLITPGTYDISVNNGGYESNPVAFTVTGGIIETRPTLQVLSPNGGETWTQGTMQTIKWQDASRAAVINCFAAPCTPPPTAMHSYDIKLVPYNPACTDDSCYAPRTIATNVFGSSYDWKIPYCTVNNSCSSNFQIAAGAYQIWVCQSGTNTCDSSDSYFKIASGSTGNLPPVIRGVTAPTTLNIGQVGKWTVYASDPENGPLNYAIDWGDNNPTIYPFSPTPIQMSQTSVFTHSYAGSGNYKVTITVTDNAGASVMSSATVAVGQTVTSQPSIKIYGDVLRAGGAKGEPSALSVNVGDTFTISGTPQGLQGLSYWFGTGYPPTGYFNRAYFFDQAFSNNNVCGNGAAPVDGVWTMTCTAKVPGSSYVYIEIYANGQTYRSNTIDVTIVPTSSELSISVDPNVPPKQMIVSGLTNTLFATYKLDASLSSENLMVTSLPLQLSLAGGASVYGVSSCRIYDGTIPLNTGSYMVHPTENGTHEYKFMFDQPLIVVKGTIKSLVLKCDVAVSSASGNAFSWGISSNTPVLVTGVTSGTVMPARIIASYGQYQIVGSSVNPPTPTPLPPPILPLPPTPLPTPPIPVTPPTPTPVTPLPPTSYAPTAITVLSPNGGETWTRGTNPAVTWTGGTNASTVNISISDQNGVGEYLIAQDVPNTGSFTFSTWKDVYGGSFPNSTYKVKIYKYMSTYPQYYIIGNGAAPFTITGTVTTTGTGNQNLANTLSSMQAVLQAMSQSLR